MHMLGALLSVMLLGLLTMHMARSTHAVQTDMWQNEVLTQVTGVGANLLEHVARKPFDEHTDENPAKHGGDVTYPVITSNTQLTAAVDFGGCASLSHVYITCDDVDDFHGLTVDDVAGDVPYSMTVSVQYVDLTNPTTPAGAKTFAKEVSLVITTPLLQIGDQPVEMTLSRVVTYNRHITAP